MQHQTDRRTVRRRSLSGVGGWLFVAVCVCVLGPRTVRAEAVSDLLVVISEDGRNYTAEQVISSNGELLLLSQPADRRIITSRASGDQWVETPAGGTSEPDRLSLWSGTYLSLYQHRYGRGLSELQPGIFELDALVEHPRLLAEDTDDMHWSVSWLLPANARLLDTHHRHLSAAAAPDDNPQMQETDSPGQWQIRDQLVRYTQTGGSLAQLVIRYAIVTPEQNTTLMQGVDCRSQAGHERCAPDSDRDGIPDTRDLCRSRDQDSTEAVSAAHSSASPPLARVDTGTGIDSATSVPPAENPLGCDGQTRIVLEGIRFRAGDSYLNVATRQVLDKVALALQSGPDDVYEISSHTDNAGRVDDNQKLTEKRAAAMRNYLLLGGVDPQRLRARGYGETSPANDNTSAAGRRSNHRAELRRLD